MFAIVLKLYVSFLGWIKMAQTASGRLAGLGCGVPAQHPWPNVLVALKALDDHLREADTQKISGIRPDRIFDLPAGVVSISL